jgi:hypothetical protein
MLSGSSKCLAPQAMTPCAWSILTLGKSSKKSRIEIPACKCQNKLCTGTRVPLKTGLPNWIFGSTVIKSESLSIFKYNQTNANF